MFTAVCSHKTGQGMKPPMNVSLLFTSAQCIYLRFSCLVHVTSVHIRASSVLRLVVHPSEGIFGDRYADGKTAILQTPSCRNGESLEETVGQDIDVDMRGCARYVVRGRRDLLES